MGRLENLIWNRKKWGWTGVCLCICFLAGCRQECEIGPDLPGDGMFLTYNSDAEPMEGITDHVRVIVFSGSSASGEKTFRYNGEFSGLTGKIPLRAGEYHDIYTVINEEADMAGVNTLEALNAVQISKNLPQDAKALVQRFHCFKNVYARGDGSGVILDEAGRDISNEGLKQSEYTMAKVDLAFDLNPTTKEGITLKFTGVQLTGLPKYGFLWPPRTYNGTEYNSQSINVPVTLPGQQYRFNTEVLIPEYLVSGDRKAVMVIQADRFRGSEKIGSSEFRFPVGNAINGSTDYNINRGKVYKFKFTAITGMGIQVDDWKVTKGVNDWEQHSADTEISEAYGFFLQTDLLDDFKAFRMPRYVNFHAEGPGAVWIDELRDAATGNAVAPNDLRVRVLWDDDTHKGGKLQIQLGNWRTGGGYTAKLKMRANNIERTLTIKCVGARYSVRELGKLQWFTAMGYTNAVANQYAGSLPFDILIREYSKGTDYRGCAGYFEGNQNDPLTGIGCWRLPTIREGLQYMSDTRKPPNYRLWAYEMGENPSKSYTSFFSEGKLPPDMHHPPNWYIPQGQRGDLIDVMCVQDDRLEKYYNVEVNAADYPEGVTYAEAQSICADLNENGETDWRLPTSAESAYALVNAGTQGIPNNLNAGLYWLQGGVAAGVDNPGGTSGPPGGVANVRCVRNRW